MVVVVVVVVINSLSISIEKSRRRWWWWFAFITPSEMLLFKCIPMSSMLLSNRFVPMGKQSLFGDFPADYLPPGDLLLLFFSSLTG